MTEAERRAEQNRRIVERVQGVPLQSCTKLEAWMDPSYPQRIEDNDNEAETKK